MVLYTRIIKAKYKICKIVKKKNNGSIKNVFQAIIYILFYVRFCYQSLTFK